MMHADAIVADDAPRERRERHEDDVVLIDAERRRALRLEHADDAAGHVVDAQVLADRALAAEERRRRRSGRRGRRCAPCRSSSGVKRRPDVDAPARGSRSTPASTPPTLVDAVVRPPTTTRIGARAGGRDQRDVVRLAPDRVEVAEREERHAAASSWPMPLRRAGHDDEHVAAEAARSPRRRTRSRRAPIDCIITTAATPMTMPSIVSTERILLRRSAENARPAVARRSRRGLPLACRRTRCARRGRRPGGARRRRSRRRASP